MTTRTLRVRDYMSTRVVTVTGDAEIMRAVRVLIDNDVSGVAVVDGGGALVGVLTERDCIRVALQAGYHDEPGGPVAKFMSTDLRCMSPDDSLVEAAEFFAGSPFRRCPVVEQGRLVGLICRRDVLRALSEGNWFAVRDPAGGTA